MNGALSLLGAAGLLCGMSSPSALPDPERIERQVDAVCEETSIILDDARRTAPIRNLFDDGADDDEINKRRLRETLTIFAQSTTSGARSDHDRSHHAD